MQGTDDLVPDRTQISSGTKLRPDPHQPPADQDRSAIGDREQRIRARAHEIWETEGRPSDRAEAHWQQAEQEVANATSDYVLQQDESPASQQPANKKRSKRATPDQA